MTRIFLLAVMVGCLVRPLSAQTVPVTVSITSRMMVEPESDYDQVINGTTPVITSYALRVAPSSDLITTVFQRNIGKPVPDPTTHTITVPIGWTSAQFTAIPPGTYVVIAQAIGPTGPVAESLPSLPFVVPAPVPAPKAPKQPVVLP